MQHVQNLMINDPIHTRTAVVWRQASDNWDVHSRFYILILLNCEKQSVASTKSHTNSGIGLQTEPISPYLKAR